MTNKLSVGHDGSIMKIKDEVVHCWLPPILQEESQGCVKMLLIICLSITGNPLIDRMMWKGITNWERSATQHLDKT